ncbi:hypothetical protein ETB97_007437 [Aspergillus alliaceus]|uniref:Extracellular membrane protein CFEM domain-containing protein n=1 Tax=Petromyces alliaceus TaxID=209559 RepID=A0A5N7CD63_PETAA|nr:hypothetical protein BDV23DRAFT_152748 [Aspergillus alliaceus]KAF5856414.1 hypothetical protein ETB97_007437 [Aspergillus burnettii]
MWSACILILAALASQLQLGQAIDMMYRDASVCVDPPAFKECRHRAYESRGDCVKKNCYGENDPCRKACNGDATCMQEICTKDMRADCYDACSCVEAQDVIDCTATSCWNEVYSCEYGETVSGLVYSCPDANLTQIPFWPQPDNAPGGCACNSGKLTMKQVQIANHVETCGDNTTRLNELSTDEERTDYLRACQCCTMSALLASIWDTCPNTEPSLITADYWNQTLLGPFDWDSCTRYLQEYDCAGTLGFGAAAAGGTQNFYEPGKLPKNGTGMLTNTGVLSTPVSGSTFTWTFGSSAHPITAAASSTAVPSATRTGESTASQGAQKTGGSGESTAAVRSRPSILVAGTVIGLCIAWVGS